ncbi:VCBS repeat-containing protein [Marinobacter hydrocarbonoclasticus]|nr:VCBS repeat-containing protein [Marinobacter nauticus]
MTNDIVGQWITEDAGCQELFLFDSNGRFSIESGQEVLSGTYEYQKTVNVGQHHELQLTFTSQRFLPDCDGLRVSIVGETLPMFARFDKGVKLYLERTSATADFSLLPLHQWPENRVFEATVNTPFTWRLSDELSETADIELLYGPEGMELVNGVLHWPADLPHLAGIEAVKFALSGRNYFQAYQGQIEVAGLAQPMVRTGTEIPYHNGGLWVENFTGDSGNELLSVSSAGIVSLTAYNDGYQQLWSYPYRLGDDPRAVRIAPVEWLENAHREILVMSESTLYLIVGQQLAQPWYRPEDGKLIHFAVADWTGDGVDDVALLMAKEDSYYSDNEVRLLDGTDGAVVATFAAVNRATTILPVQFDGDAQLEMVLDNGLVIDSVTGEYDLELAARFDRAMAVADLDGDGQQELIGDRMIYSHASGFWSSANLSPFGDVCSLYATQLDDDAEMELVVGRCQWGYTAGINVSQDAVSEIFRLTGEEHGRIAVTGGDLDNDGENELIWGEGASSSGVDVLVFADLHPAPEVKFVNQGPSQLESFYAAGYGAITPEENGAVFVVPSAPDRSYLDGQRVVVMDEQGLLRVSDEIGSNWDDAHDGWLADFDGNGYGDIALGTADTYDGAFIVNEVDSQLRLWGELDGTYEDDVAVMLAADVTGDGHPEAFVANRYLMQIVDIANQEVVSELTLDGQVRDIAAFASEEQLKVAVTSRGDTRILVKNGDQNELQLLSRISHANCQRVQFAADGQSLYCLLSGALNEYGLDLQQRRSLELEGTAQDMLVTGNSVLIAFESDDVYVREGSHMANLSLDAGQLIWRSQNLLGDMSPRTIYQFADPTDGHTRLTFSTGNAMYLTK